MVLSIYSVQLSRVRKEVWRNKCPYSKQIIDFTSNPNYLLILPANVHLNRPVCAKAQHKEYSCEPVSLTVTTTGSIINNVTLVREVFCYNARRWLKEIYHKLVECYSLVSLCNLSFISIDVQVMTILLGFLIMIS